jgi:hypothetical protein
MTPAQLEAARPFPAAAFVVALEAAATQSAEASELSKLLSKRLDDILAKCVCPDVARRELLVAGLTQSLSLSKIAEMVERTERSHWLAITVMIEAKRLSSKLHGSH